MSRFLSVLSVMVLCACGRQEITTNKTPLTSTTNSLVGTYELGPDTAQGFAGTLGRFGHLRLHADGTFDTSFWPGGCIAYGASGTWTPFFDGAQLQVESGGWLVGPETNAHASTLTISPSNDGVLATGTDVALSQNWVLTAAGE